MQDRSLCSGAVWEWEVVWLSWSRAECWVLFKGWKAEQKISRIMFGPSNTSSHSRHDPCIAPLLLWGVKPGEATETGAQMELCSPVHSGKTLMPQEIHGLKSTSLSQWFISRAELLFCDQPKCLILLRAEQVILNEPSVSCRSWSYWNMMWIYIIWLGDFWFSFLHSWISILFLRTSQG